MKFNESMIRLANLAKRLNGILVCEATADQTATAYKLIKRGYLAEVSDDANEPLRYWHTIKSRKILGEME